MKPDALARVKSSRHRNFHLIAGFFGFGLCVVGLWHLLKFLQDAELGAYLSNLASTQIICVCLLTVGLSVANGLIAQSWRAVLNEFGGNLSIFRAHFIFSQSNLGKYVPGNVLHMVGRHVLSMREGVSGWAAAKSITVETGILVLASGIMAVLIFGLRDTEKAYLAPFAGVLFLFVLTIVVVFLRSVNRRKIAFAVVGYSFYHIMGGLIFGLLLFCLDLSAASQASFGILVGAYVASWVLGMLTPGAPAGLGVRESVLLALLHSSVPDSTLLGALVVLSRGMSVVADLLYFSGVQALSILSTRHDIGGKSES